LIYHIDKVFKKIKIDYTMNCLEHNNLSEKWQRQKGISHTPDAEKTVI
jgi:hypothetical protein